MEYKYNEREYAKIIYEKGFQTTFIRYELVILVKYLKEQKYNKKDTETFLYDFCRKYIEDFNEVLFYSTIDGAIKDGRKRNKKLIEIKSIDFYEEELKYIDKFKIDSNYKKLLLTFLFKKKIGMEISKIINPSNTEIKMSGYFDGSNKKFREIFKMANIENTKENKYDINLMIKELVTKKIFTSMIKGNIGLEYINEMPKCEKVFYSLPREGFNNIGYIYDYYKQENNIKECSKCHVLYKSKNNKQKYCKSCAYKIKLEQTRELAKNSMKELRKTKNVKKIENR